MLFRLYLFVQYDFRSFSLIFSSWKNTCFEFFNEKKKSEGTHELYRWVLVIHYKLIYSSNSHQ